VTGKLVDGGQTMTFEGHDYEEGASSVEVNFYPLDDSGNIAQGEGVESFSTTVKPDGTFVADGGTGDGITVGKYKVTLRHRKAGSRDKSAQGDEFGGKFSLENTPFTIDIQSDGQEVVLDVGGGAS
jgi:hypothetical protein